MSFAPPAGHKDQMICEAQAGARLKGPAQG
jgi:hypothetical protein